MGIYRRKYPDKKTGELRIAKVWSYRFADGRRVSLKTKDERIALLKAAELERADGAPPHERTRLTPLKQIVDDYLAELRRTGRRENYVSSIATTLGRIVAGLTSVSQLTPERIGQILEHLARTAPAHEMRPQGGLSANTQNRYRAALSGLFSWLVRLDRWPRNPVDAVEVAKVRGPQRERDPISAAELEALVERAPIQRAACYLLAMSTGLRRAELRTLPERQVDLERAVVRVRADDTKNSDEATLVLPEWTVAVLRRYVAECPPDRQVAPNNTPPRGDRLFAAIPTNTTLRADLIAAGVDLAGRRVDFHGLRVSYCTWLAQLGVPLQVAQRLMRHSSPVLTANVYTRVTLVDAQAVAAQLAPRAGVPGSVPGEADESRRDGRLREVEREPAKGRRKRKDRSA